MLPSPNTALYTDLYQLTMAQGYWRHGLGDQQATFHLSFRKHPFGGSFTVAAGLAQVIEWVENLAFGESELAYLSRLKTPSGNPLFDSSFLGHLKQIRFTGEIAAVPEGTLVFPHTPLVRVTAPLLEAQLLETSLLTLINFQSLIATKSARIVLAAQGDPVLEFGLRRAHGLNGGLSASRAAFIGGCTASSNVMAGYQFGIPVKGTHAHSWVMVFEQELSAFEAYAQAYPDATVLLVDTYDTLQGVQRAIEVGHRLRENGAELAGIRLDSGDLAALSKQARTMLDQAGFPAVKIVASNDLDEYTITSLKEATAPIDTWGVGTRLVTAYDQPALGGVYKLGAIQELDNTWRNVIKESAQASKTTNPGRHQVYRMIQNGVPVADLLTDVSESRMPSIGIPLDRPHETMAISGKSDLLLQVVMKDGHTILPSPSLSTIQQRTQTQLAKFGITRFDQEVSYPVLLSSYVFEEKMRLLSQPESVS